MQRTIRKETSLEGIGLHSGENVHLRFKPAGINQGIIFRRVDLSPSQDITIKDFEFGTPMRRTTISKKGIEIHTVEHLMAVLWALSIDNIIVEIDGGEMPGLDGSALGYYTSLEGAGIDEQDAPAKVFKVKEPLWCERNETFIGIFPSNGFKISYILDSPSPSLKRQYLSLSLDRKAFSEEIVGARTFCLKEEAEELLKMGFGKGANTKNTLVMDEGGPIDNVLRFPDEPVRHKILDLIGDLYLIGAYIQGRLIAIGSGHELNMELVKEIKTQMIGINKDPSE